MKAIEILYNLSPYQKLLDELYEKVSKEKSDSAWTKSISNQYSFITLELSKTSKEESEEDGKLAVQITFEIQRDKVNLTNVYCEEESEKEALEKQIKSNEALHDVPWHKEPNNTWYHDEVVTGYINMADQIAEVAQYCAAGDDYRPGNFSEIKVSSTKILLSQINLHNSRSSAHKEDYYMRKLNFHIPLVGEPQTVRWDDIYKIGNMTISFSDHSSAKNKACGKKIVEQILQQQKGFQNKE